MHTQLRVLNLTQQTELARRAELAGSFYTRGRGLLGRPGLEEGSGMWIVPGSRIHMCGMRFAIDAVFLSRGQQVTGLYEDLQPQPVWALWRTYGGGRGAHSVLELPAGTVRLSGTRVGDQLQIGQVTP
jgi:uncharacterized membrane protein (UPF0127 family)